MHQLGVQLRDLRLLDPHLNTSYPSALLCRDKALVVNLEHIKCIITKDEVYIVNADEERVVRTRSIHEIGPAGTVIGAVAGARHDPLEVTVTNMCGGPEYWGRPKRRTRSRR